MVQNVTHQFTGTIQIRSVYQIIRAHGRSWTTSTQMEREFKALRTQTTVSTKPMKNRIQYQPFAHCCNNFGRLPGPFTSAELALMAENRYSSSTTTGEFNRSKSRSQSTGTMLSNSTRYIRNPCMPEEIGRLPRWGPSSKGLARGQKLWSTSQEKPR